MRSSLQSNAFSGFILVLFEDEVARLLALNLTHDYFPGTFLNPFEGRSVNDLLRFETELLGAEDVHDREDDFLLSVVSELTPFVECTLKQIKDKKPFLLGDGMEVLTEPGIEGQKVQVLPNILPHHQLSIPIAIKINDRLDNSLQIPQPGRVDLLIFHGHEHAAGGPVVKGDFIVQYKFDSLFGQGVR
jgi:hypothetical protein